MKTLRKIGASIAAALTTPTAIRAEKSIAVVVLLRLAMTLPAYAWIIDVIVKQLS